MSTADRSKLQYERMRPMYDKDVHRFAKSLAGNTFLDQPKELHRAFQIQFHKWVTGSKLNRIHGLEKFAYQDIIVGVTHVIDDLHQTRGSRLVILDKEYPYHLRLRPEMTVRSIDTLTGGDELMVSMPFSYIGGVHPSMNEILDRCFEIGVPVHVDSAWFGCTRGIEFDYSHPAIVSASFSLSKGLGLGANRSGLRYSTERWRGPVTIQNDFSYFIDHSLFIGLKFMERFGSDYFQMKYADAYAQVCRELGLEATPTIHIAMEERANGVRVPVGIRELLREIADR